MKARSLDEIRADLRAWGKESGHDGMYPESELFPYAMIDRLDRIIELLSPPIAPECPTNPKGTHWYPGPYACCSFCGYVTPEVQAKTDALIARDMRRNG